MREEVGDFSGAELVKKFIGRVKEQAKKIEEPAVVVEEPVEVVEEPIAEKTFKE
jgi:hypothetical protein